MDELVKNVNAIDTSALDKKKTDYDAKITEITDETLSIADVPATATLHDADNKISNVSNLVLKKKQIMM